MKTKLSIALLSLLVIAAVAIQAFPGQASHTGDSGDLPERDEFHQTYQLEPNARVEVSGINGPVEIETYAGATAEVTIVRSARTKEDLDYRKITVEQTPSSLVVRGESVRDRDWGRGRDRELRERVSLRLPRQIHLAMSGINGRAHVGEIDGPVRLSGINGRVTVGRASGYVNLSGINGVVTVMVMVLGEKGIDVSGVNGRVELRFADNVNADLNVVGTNGSVDADLPNVTIIGKQTRQNFRAKIGTGGVPISVSGVNGNVRLTRATPAG